MKKLNVVLHPGRVRSKNDGQHHFINADRLARLYGVLPTDNIQIYQERMSRFYPKDAIHLYPDYKGLYKNIHQKQ